MVQSLFDVLDFRANDVPWRPWRAGGTWGVVDPSGCFGQPILNAQGVSVRIIAAAYATNPSYSPYVTAIDTLRINNI